MPTTTATWYPDVAVLAKRTATINTDGVISQTNIYEGSLSALRGLGMTVGAFIPDQIIDGLAAKINSITYATGVQSAKAQLTVEASTAFNGTGAASDTSYELEWQRVDKDIRYHPDFENMTDEQRALVDEWLRASATRRAQIVGNSPWDADCTKLKKKLARGESSYPVFVPVARKVHRDTTRPSTGDCGTIQSPPSQCGAPSGYTYVKMADRCVKQSGAWTRTQEWVGVDYADPDIYS